MCRYAYRKYTKMYKEYMSNKQTNGPITTDNTMTSQGDDVTTKTNNGTSEISNGTAYSQGDKAKEE